MKMNPRFLLMASYIAFLLLGIYGVFFGQQGASDVEPIDPLYIIEIEDNPGVPLASGITVCEICNPPD